MVLERCKLQIDLKSDMCVSDGGVYNSSLDTDVVHDFYGFPYIPAKRIKGCLREIALELKDMGLDVDPEVLFGAEGNSIGIVRISDAVVKDINRFREEIDKSRNSVIYHPQNVLNLFTYIRTQTSINYRTGVADDKSLRSMRVIKKGISFISMVDIMDEACSEAFHKCCIALRHMGVSRTRGLGEVRCSVIPIDSEEETKPESIFSLEEGANRLYYTIDLLEPVIIKSTNGGESRSLDYIDGSKILGAVVEKLKNNNENDAENITEIIQKGKLFFSNAYIEENGKRMVEVPASLYSVKDNDNIIIDGVIKDSGVDEKRQLNQIKHCYVSISEGKITNKKSVKMEDRYHHRRPKDKSIGRAVKNDDNSDFYSMSSICAGQKFIGYIHGAPEQIATIAKLFDDNPQTYIGYSRMSEYGRVRIECVGSEKCVAKVVNEPIEELKIKLESPTLIYDNNAMYSLRQDTLVDEILSCLNIKGKRIELIKEVESFINYGQIGGYNVTWGYRKPVVGVFEKGSFIRIVFNEPQYYTVPENCALGERTVEGMGEFSIQIGNTDREYRMNNNNIEKSLDKVEISDVTLAKDIADMLYKKFVPYYAAKLLNEFDKKIKSRKDKEKYRPTVSNMIQMCNESHSLEDIRNTVKKRYNKASEEKKIKEEYANHIIGLVEKGQGDLIKEFEEQYNICFYTNLNSEMLLLKEFLICLKYSIRERKAGEKE